ncbi:hypothetical protein HanIR_Chr11g0534211 [Helianthus annuus]|nr:hypothetical protein HanIR_Chr11g0534211 [Helianthus annuus]
MSKWFIPFIYLLLIYLSAEYNNTKVIPFNAFTVSQQMVGVLKKTLMVLY